jgi:hypothetical protein
LTEFMGLVISELRNCYLINKNPGIFFRASIMNGKF